MKGDIFEIINQIILFLLSLSTFIGILDFVGFLPSFIRKRLCLNRMRDALDLLHEFGIDIEQRKRINDALNYPQKFAGENLKEITSKALEQYKINKPLAVGQSRPTSVDYYFDLIGGTCNGEVAEYFAHLLSTYWAENLNGDNRIEKIDYDFIVTPKGGSPILGYEFSKLVCKPFVLHEERSRFSIKNDMRDIFDCHVVPKKGAVALIVDDSTTGGRMVCNTIDDLRKYGYQVHTCLVVFAPGIKNAKRRILDKNVQLISIVETHC